MLVYVRVCIDFNFNRIAEINYEGRDARDQRRQDIPLPLPTLYLIAFNISPIHQTKPSQTEPFN